MTTLAAIAALLGWSLAFREIRRANGWREAWAKEVEAHRVAVVPIPGSTAGDSYRVSTQCDECESTVDIVVIANPGRVIGITDGGIN